jgi:hypothetical protein
MSGERFTITTEGSRTVVHWEGKRGKSIARPTSTGRFFPDPKSQAADDVEKPKKPRRRKKRR